MNTESADSGVESVGYYARFFEPDGSARRANHDYWTPICGGDVDTDQYERMCDEIDRLRADNALLHRTLCRYCRSDYEGKIASDAGSGVGEADSDRPTTTQRNGVDPEPVADLKPVRSNTHWKDDND